MPANKNAMTRYALLDHLLQDRRRNWSIQDMTDYLAEHLPEYGSEPVVIGNFAWTNFRKVKYPFFYKGKAFINLYIAKRTN